MNLVYGLHCGTHHEYCDGLMVGKNLVYGLHEYFDEARLETMIDDGHEQPSNMIENMMHFYKEFFINLLLQQKWFFFQKIKIVFVFIS